MDIDTDMKMDRTARACLASPSLGATTRTTYVETQAGSASVRVSTSREERAMQRHLIYQQLGRRKAEFLALVEKQAGKVGVPKAWAGTIGLTGSNSARPAYLRRDIVESLVQGARSPKNLVDAIEEIRVEVKAEYGEDYDAVPINSCEAALWASLDTLAAPPLAGRGDSYRTRYVALYESHAEHQVSYGRPFPPRYKDIFADRTNIAGELGVLGRRLNNLDVIITPIEGARYEAHGIKSFIVPLLTKTNAARTRRALARVIERHVDSVSALVSLGYDSPGYGYREKRDGVTPDLKAAMGALAAEYGLPYIVDNARGIPFLGAHPKKLGAGVVLYSMDKVAGAPISGLIVARNEFAIPLQRALGWHSERFGGGTMTYGKGAFAAFDPGREALIGQLAALRWIRANKRVIRGMVDAAFRILKEESAPLVKTWGDGIVLSRSYNGGAVELNYVDTWTPGGVGIPIFSTEDKAAGMNLVTAGLAALGVLPPSPDEGNVVMTFGRGLLDEDGRLVEDKTRIAMRALVAVLRTLGDFTRSIAKG